MEIGSFKITGHSTKRNWSVYLFIATPITGHGIKKVYIGKVGDNRKGCNPVISRVGNHFSYNSIHSQIRNRLVTPENYDYEYFYCHFDKYEPDASNRNFSREKTNELERELNRKVQELIKDKDDYVILNPFNGKYVSKSEKDNRSKLINVSEKQLLEELCKKSFSIA